MFQRWRVVLDTGIHVYEENTKTGTRRIRRYNDDGYQPVDEQWLQSGVFHIPIPPAKTG